VAGATPATAPAASELSGKDGATGTKVPKIVLDSDEDKSLDETDQVSIGKKVLAEMVIRDVSLVLLNP
jgi:hypothetical protein